MRSNHTARVIPQLFLTVIFAAGSAWAQGPDRRQVEIEFGGLVSSISAATAANEGVGDWSYGIRAAGGLSQGSLAIGAEVGALFFPEDYETEATRYTTSGYLASVSAGLRNLALRQGSLGLSAGAHIGGSLVGASRTEIGRNRITRTASSIGTPGPLVRGGLFLEPLLQLEAEDIGASLRYRFYDRSSSLRTVLTLSVFVPIRGSVAYGRGPSRRPRR